MRKGTSRRENKLSKHIQGLFEMELKNCLRCCEMYAINSLFSTVKNRKNKISKQYMREKLIYCLQKWKMEYNKE